MRNSRLLIAVGCWLAAGSLALSGTATHQAGLWEVSTKTTWQKSPRLPGVDNDKLRLGSHTSQVCLTQEMIDNYGALMPQGRGSCTIQNRTMAAGKLTGDYICSGMMAGKGLLESTWTDAEHATGRVHFVGTYMVDSVAQPIEWTTEMTSTFKSSSCGMIKPKPLPNR